ncbi:MAG: energy transducer TonB [Bacteroidota bacterium]
MTLKKHPRFDLEKKRIRFFQIGLIVTLAFVWMALEWKSYEGNDFDFGVLKGDPIDEEIIPITQREVKPPPPPPPEIFKIVKDDEEIKKAFEVVDNDLTQKTPIKKIDEPEIDDSLDNIAFLVVEEMPTFGNGDKDLINYLAKNIKYPEMAKNAGIQGTVNLSFIVNKKGKITNVKVLRGIGGGCDEEAMRIVKNMPRWNPGKQRGKPVKVSFSLPVRFKLY